MGLQPPEEAGTECSLLMGMLVCLQAVWGKRSKLDREGGSLHLPGGEVL